MLAEIMLAFEQKGHAIVNPKELVVATDDERAHVLI